MKIHTELGKKKTRLRRVQVRKIEESIKQQKKQKSLSIYENAFVKRVLNPSEFWKKVQMNLIQRSYFSSIEILFISKIKGGPFGPPARIQQLGKRLIISLRDGNILLLLLKSRKNYASP